MGIDPLPERPLGLLARLKHDTQKALVLPARLLARAPAPAHTRDAALHAQPQPSLFPLPGPWGFLTSGYLAGLVVTAILLHRIHNIVVPPRHRPFSPRHVHPALLHTPTLTQALCRAFFPLDLSSSRTRLALRLPTLCLLARALVAWLVTLAQTAGRFPSQGSPCLLRLGHWVAYQEMATLCWSTFCTVCATLCVEALSRGFDGGSPTGSPFNLFGYAFVLHVYSSPMAHGKKLGALASRPDKHVVFTILLPLLQLTMAHCIGIKQRWSHHRLIPSATACLLGLVHFHWVLWFSSASYPLLNYMPCLFETILLSSIALAAFLNTLTQLVTQGTVTRPLFGHSAALVPRWDEDFSIALLRVGTASLETSAVAGLGNQVGSVAVLSGTQAGATGHDATVELGRFSVASISPALELRGDVRRLAKKRGLANDIRCVKPASGESDLWFNMAWCREAARFGVGVVRWARRLCRLCLGGRAEVHGQRVLAGDVGEEKGDDGRREEGEGDAAQDWYARFVRGEEVSDDEHDEFEPGSRSHSRSSVSSWESASDEDADADCDGGADADALETVGLYADLASTVSAPASASLLLAHMADTSSSPLTRRRFDRLVLGGGRPEGDGGGACATTGAVWGGDGRSCVVCMVEPRQIICWPCRCLALCDDCRENLASRSSASKHTCPCCRRAVEGYSRIYLP